MQPLLPTVSGIGSPKWLKADFLQRTGAIVLESSFRICYGLKHAEKEIKHWDSRLWLHGPGPFECLPQGKQVF